MPSQSIIPDTSFIISLLTPESNTPLAKQIFINLQNHPVNFIAPNYLQIEFFTVIRKKVHFKTLSSSNAKEIIQVFNNLPIKYIPQNQKALYLAFDLAQNLHQPTIYDTLFLSLAIEKQATYITNDKKFAKKASKLHTNCLSLEETMPAFT